VGEEQGCLDNNYHRNRPDMKTFRERGERREGGDGGKGRIRQGFPGVRQIPCDSTVLGKGGKGERKREEGEALDSGPLALARISLTRGDFPTEKGGGRRKRRGGLQPCCRFMRKTTSINAGFPPPAEGGGGGGGGRTSLICGGASGRGSGSMIRRKREGRRGEGEERAAGTANPSSSARRDGRGGG